jgi:hypothetical protein
LSDGINAPLMMNKFISIFILIIILSGCGQKTDNNQAASQNDDTEAIEAAAEIDLNHSDLYTHNDTTMTEIPDTLKMHAEASPDSLFTVLIVIEKGSDVAMLSIKDPERLMDNIFKAEISGAKIMELIEIDIVKSIEEDAEVWGH